MPTVDMKIYVPTPDRPQQCYSWIFPNCAWQVSTHHVGCYGTIIISLQPTCIWWMLTAITI